MELIEMLNQPPREFTPIPFWFLNGDLKKEEIRRQLRDFCAHGVYGVVLHPRIGMAKRIGYLSGTFFSYIRTAVRSAAELNMKVVLYDEGMYPSGAAGGQVVRDNPDFASRGIVRVKSVQADDGLVWDGGEWKLAVRKSGGTIRGIHWGEDDGQTGAPASADILNPEAVEKFLQLTHEAYYRELGEWFGTTIIGIFTDEPSILGRNVRDMLPWTKGFEACYTAAGGRLSGLLELFEGKENEDTGLYRRLIREREEKVYYGCLSQWCKDHGIALMGHPHQSDDIEAQKYFHVPGQDLALRWVAPEKPFDTGMDTVMAKCSADAARLLGRRRNSNECFGACNRNGNPWQFSGGDMKWYIDWLAVRGVNLFIPHAFYYSIAGKRKQERPPDVGPNSSWWPYYEKWSVYMHRVSALMTDIRLYAKTALPCRDRDLKPCMAAELMRRHVGFQYIPGSLWRDCREKDGALHYRGQSFRYVLGEEKRFPAVKHVPVDRILPDCICDPAAPSLRVARFTRLERECCFFVNEGEEALETLVTIPDGDAFGFLASYDLWSGRTFRLQAEKTSSGPCFLLRLPHRGSVLIFGCSAKEYDALPERTQDALPFEPRFSLVREDESRVEKEYRAEVCWDPQMTGSPGTEESGRRICLEVQAEEMAQLYVNGVSAGVEFWPPQRFEIGGLLKEGKNELRLVVTGSLANLYGKTKVWYGLKGLPD